jgi:hypothetical protein
MTKIRAILFALLLGGCATTAATINAIVAQVQTITASACAFVPTVTTVVDVYNAAIGATVQTIANEICAVVAAIPPISTSASARLRAVAPAMVQVNGVMVPVHGTFTGGVNAGKII